MSAPAESPPVFERERERVDSSSGFRRHHKILFGILVAVGVLVYASFNVWVYRYAKSGKAPSPTLNNSSPAPTPTPTPRPKGPGEYACSPEGVCNLYSDAMRKEFCTQTYADILCLDQCGDKEKQCSN